MCILTTIHLLHLSFYNVKNKNMEYIQMMSYLFIQVANQDICFIKEGDVAFPPEEIQGSIQRQRWTDSLCSQR